MALTTIGLIVCIVLLCVAVVLMLVYVFVSFGKGERTQAAVSLLMAMSFAWTAATTTGWERIVLWIVSVLMVYSAAQYLWRWYRKRETATPAER